MQKVKILMRRLDVSSGFSLFANVCPNLPAVRSYLTLPYMHFFVVLAFFSFQLKTIRSEKSPLDMDASTVYFYPFKQYTRYKNVYGHSLISAFVICLMQSTFIIYRLATSEHSIFSLVSVAEQTGLSFTLSENPKAGFQWPWPIWFQHGFQTMGDNSEIE